MIMANHLFNVSDDLDDRTFQHMHVPCLKDDISMAGPRAFVKIMHLYLRTADIWICWFGHFAFVKPSSLHLQTCDINASFGASLDFSKYNVCIFQLQSSAFADRWFIHICQEFVVFFTAHQSEFIRPTHFHSALSWEWWMVMKRTIWSQMVMDEGIEHRWISSKKIVFSNSNHLHLQTGDIRVCQSFTPALDKPVTFSDYWVWCTFCKQATQKNINWKLWFVFLPPNFSLSMPFCLV